MGLKIVNLGRLEYESFGEGVRFAARWGDVSRPAGGRKIGCGVWEIPPGKAATPYHYHRVDEELIVVLGGSPSLRLAGVEHVLNPDDVVALPPGEASAHQVINRSTAPARLLIASTMPRYDAVRYPDSGKRLYRLGSLADEPGRESVMLMDDQVMPPSGPLGVPYFKLEGGECALDPAVPAVERDASIVAIGDGVWESYRFGPFTGRRNRVGLAAGARALGLSVYRADRGEQLWPYHLHHVNEELFWVRSGHGCLRVPDGTRDLEPGDVVVCPPGPDGAHALEAVDTEFEVLALSTMEEPEVCEYPDSGKVYVMVGAPPGGDREARAVDLVFRRADAVSYEDPER